MALPGGVVVQETQVIGHDQGTYTYANGHKHVGEYKDGKAHGQGEFSFVDGSKYVGEYKYGKSWEGTMYDKDGNAAVTYSEGVQKYGN